MYFLKRWAKKENLSVKPPSSGSLASRLLRSRDAVFSLLLVLLNLFFLWSFFGQEYPIINFSAPILPFLSQLVSFLTPLNFSQALGLLVLISFPLSSLTWYAFFKKLSSNYLLSFMGSLIFLLPWFFLPRFVLFWQKGDGVHALGFAILPLTGILFGRFLKIGSFNLFLAAFLGVSLISLISPFSLLNLYLLFLIFTFSEMLLGEARVKILRFLVVCIFAQGLASFWYHPNFIWAILQSTQGQAVIVSFWKLFPISFFTVPVLGALSFLVFDRKPQLQPLFFSLSLTVLYLALVAAESFGDYLLFPVPARFFPEFYIALSFLIALIINFLINFPKGKFSLFKIHPSLAFAHHSSEVFLTSILTGLLVWPAFSFFSQVPVVPPPEFSTPQVLGAQSAWWEVSRDGISQILGFVITFLTAGTGLFLKKKIKS